METRTRSRVDNETRTTFGKTTEVWRCDRGTSTQSFPKTGPWEFKPLGLSGYDLKDDWNSINAIKHYMLVNWREFAQYTVNHGSVATGYSQLGRSTITDVPTRDFKRRSAAGEIINNAYNRSKVEFKSSLAEEVTGYANEATTVLDNWTNWSIDIFVHSAYEEKHTVSLSLPLQVIEFLSDLRLEVPGRQTAINNAFGNIQQGEVELLVMAAEGRKTVQHLVSVVVRFAKLVRALKTGNFKELSPKVYKRWKEGAYGKTATAADVFADAWMEARYAWVPTVMDAIGAFNILTGAVEKRQTFRGKESEAYVEEIDRLIDCGFAQVRLKANLFGDLTCRAGVLTAARIDSPNLQSTGLFNMATAVKEVIPYSFVLEWFVNLSGILYYLNPNPLLAPLAAWATDASELQITGHVEWEHSPGQILTVPISGRLTSKVRTPIDGPSIFTIDVNLGIARILDGAILLLRNLR